MKLNNIKQTFLAGAALLSTISMSAADRFVNFKQGDLLLNANNRVEIYMDTNDCKGVSYAAHALLKDIKSVSGATATLTSDAGFLKKADTARPAILVGTIGHSAAIDQLVKQKRINEAIEKVAMFEAMYSEYAQNPAITRTRMYYETISQVLPGVKLYINTGGQGGDVQMLLPLESLAGTEGGNAK